MKEDYSQAAAELIGRISTSSRATNPPPQPTKVINVDAFRVVINRAEHCTFIVGASAQQIFDGVRAAPGGHASFKSDRQA